MSLILFMVKCVSLLTGDMFSCNVERDARHNQQCRLRQDHTDDFDWTCNRGKTPSSKQFYRIINKHKYPITGPDSAKYGRNYLYASIAGNGRHKVARQEYVHSN